MTASAWILPQTVTLKRATTDRVHALQDFTGSFTADLDDSFGMVSIGTSCLQNDSFEDDWTG
jgi:hypothetical protein